MIPEFLQGVLDVVRENFNKNASKKKGFLYPVILAESSEETLDIIAVDNGFMKTQEHKDKLSQILVKLTSTHKQFAFIAEAKATSVSTGKQADVVHVTYHCMKEQINVMAAVTVDGNRRVLGEWGLSKNPPGGGRFDDLFLKAQKSKREYQ